MYSIWIVLTITPVHPRPTLRLGMSQALLKQRMKRTAYFRYDRAGETAYFRYGALKIRYFLHVFSNFDILYAVLEKIVAVPSSSVLAR